MSEPMTVAEACAAVDAWGETEQFGVHRIARALRAEVAKLRARTDLRAHDRLNAAMHWLPGDYEPWGLEPRDRGGEWGADCLMGCRWYHPLKGAAGADWGVCCNPASHRCGRLTFEHQGCWQFEAKGK